MESQNLSVIRPSDDYLSNDDRINCSTVCTDFAAEFTSPLKYSYCREIRTFQLAVNKLFRSAIDSSLEIKVTHN